MGMRRIARLAIVFAPGLVVLTAHAWAQLSSSRTAAPQWLTSETAPSEMRAGLDPKRRDRDERALAALQAKLAQAERQRHARDAAESRRRLAHIRELGGVQAAMRTALAGGVAGASRLGEEFVQRADRLKALVDRPCQVPTIYGEVSRYLNVIDKDHPYPAFGENRDVDLVVEPTALVVIAGCHFGAEAGEVRLVVNPATGGYLKLQLAGSGWSDDAIEATLDAHPGYPDQAAQLVVVGKDGTPGDPLPVEFRQRRTAIYLDSYNHPETLSVDCAAITSDDRCVGLLVSDTQGKAYMRDGLGGYHKQNCCSSKSGTDQWTVKLTNGWTLIEEGTLASDDKLGWYETAQVPWVYPLSWSTDFGGFTVCDLFNEEGKVTGTAATVLSHEPYEARIDVSWWVDWACSGIAYAGNVWILGPEGVQYW